MLKRFDQVSRDSISGNEGEGNFIRTMNIYMHMKLSLSLLFRCVQGNFITHLKKPPLRNRALTACTFKFIFN